MKRKLVAFVATVGLCLTTGALVAPPATSRVSVASAAAPTGPTDQSKVPHYFGPYANWAYSPQVMADAIVGISLGTPTPVAFGNPLTARANATDYATAPGTLGPVFVALPGAPLPAGTLQSFQTWNQADKAGSPTSSAGGLFHAYVLRPTGTANQYTAVYDSGQLVVPALANPAVSEVATYTMPNVPVNAGDVLGFYGQGIPVDTGITANQDLFSYPATADPTLATNAAPAIGSTLTVGTDAGFPMYPTQDRTYSFSAMVTPTIPAPSTGAQATATVDPTTGGISAITVTDPGAGYVVPPAVSITSPGITPSALASATAVIGTGVVTSIAVNEAGFGFTAPQVTLTGGGPTTPAIAQASGGVDNLTLSSGGTGYVNQPLVQFSTPNLPNGVAPTATATMANGVVTGITLVTPGSGYTSAPTVTILDANAVNPTAASAVATIGIGKIDITSGGLGYTTVPTVAILDNGTTDLGASATATIAVKGAVTAINVTAPGAGYLTPGLKKFVDTLPGLTPAGANNYGQYIPVAVPDQTTYPGADYYEIAVVQYRQKFSSQLPATLLRGYVQLSTGVIPGNHVALTNANLDGTTTPIAGYFGVDAPHYLGPTIIAQKNRPVRILFRNLLPTGVGGDLFLPVDTSIMGSGPGPNAVMADPATVQPDGSFVPMDMATDLGTVTDGVRNPACNDVPKPLDPATGKGVCYSENRATLHLHGGVTPWISDGTPHQWTTPAGENTDYPQGVSVSNVPDMPDPGPGAETFFYTNQQSARLMFYHDHAWGITRLNVYAGEAAGYVLTDAMEQSLIAPTGALAGLGVGTPLIIQDKTFVSKTVASGNIDPTKGPVSTDPTWDANRWGGEGSLWVPHVYMPAQNPGDPSGASSFGRWFYGPWFWPPAKDAKYPPIANPYYDPTCDANVILPDGSNQFCEPKLIPSTPNVSVGMEAFNDTPIVNGTAYPTTTVDPKAYRYRILNAANDRFWNLQWYVADPTTGTLSEVALKSSEVAAAQTDPNVFPTPDTTLSPAGPSWIQIGTEGGFLPTPVVVPNQPTTWITDPTRFDFGNVKDHALLLAPAERADVIVDFSQYRGKTLILYNDAPAAFPARVPGYDFYTGDPDMSPAGAPSTLPGYGPNTRTIMQVKVSNAAPATAFDRPNTTADRMGALQAAFAHHLDANGKPAGVFESSEDPIIVGQAAYNTAYGSNFVTSGWCNAPTASPTAKCDGFARIQEQSFDPTPPSTTPAFQFKFDTLGDTPWVNTGPQLKLRFQPKALHDELNSANFDEWGRMTANLGLEAPGATPLLQNIILYPYVNPSTEILDSSGMPSSLKVTPISTSTDGTQIWKITHNGVDTHPIHFHLYDVQVLNRVTWDNIIMPPEPTELGWKDTVRLSPLQDTIVALRPIVPTLPFAVPDSSRPLNPAMPIGARGDTNGPNGTEAGFNNTDANGNPINAIVNRIVNFGWEYVYHCHILSHEEMDMMRPVDVLVPSTQPDAPVLSFTRGSVILHWTDGTPVNYADPTTWANLKNEIGFHIQRATVINGVAGAFAPIATGLANSVTYTDVSADPSVTYDYQVSAFNKAGESMSNVIRVDGLPQAPSALTAVVQPNAALAAGSQVALGWTNNATNAVNNVVERAVVTGGVAGPFSVLATLAPTATNYIDTSVLPGAYSYRVNSVSAFGPSPYAGPVTVTVLQPASTTLEISAPNPSLVGQSVTFTATVSPVSASGVPSGTVTFTGSGPMPVDASGVATFTTSALPAGANTITATYSGDAIFSPSSGSVVQTVNKGTTSVVLSSSLNPSINGDNVTFTATVTPLTGIGAPTGSMQFFDGATSLGTSALTGNTASVSTALLAIGSHPITAVYGGDLAFNGNTSPIVTQVVSQGTTSVGLATSGSPSIFGNSVTFTATVSATTGVGVPTGSVQFFDGAASLGSSALTGNTASISTAALAVGGHAITAVYSGDAAFTTSTGGVTQTVSQGTTLTAVASSLNASVFGNSVTFTATVSVNSGVGSPTGTVQFFDGATSLGTGNLSGGTAGFSTSNLAVGSHAITAVFSGDASFAGSTSPVLTQVVQMGTTQTVTVSSLNPSVEGNLVTFTATVSPLTGSGPQTGTVQFSDGAANLGPAVALVGGKASFGTSALLAGVHSITAVYSGDINFTGSASTALSQNVLRATTTVVTSNRNPSANLGQNITFTATVRPVTGTGFPTTGSVQFKIDNANVGAPVVLNAQGRATFAIATLPAGSHTVIATYTPTTVFAGSTSVSITQVVNQAATTTTVTSNPNPSVFGQSVTFTGRVTPAAAGLTGTIQFTVDGFPQGLLTPDATGRVTLVTSTLSVGPHVVTAAFSGSVNYLPSASAPLSHTVNRGSSRTVVTTSGSPATRPAPVTFTSTVTAVAPGAGAPTGNVTFYVDGVARFTGALNASGQGQWATTSTALGVGLHTVAAVYAGDANFNGSTSANINQRIR